MRDTVRKLVEALGNSERLRAAKVALVVAKHHLKLVTPTDDIRTVTSRRKKNAELRTREHLMPGEVAALMEAAKGNRYGHRDATMILIAHQHGLRVSKLCDLRWDQIDFDTAVLHARRIKNGLPSTHPLQGDELRALRRLKREGAGVSTSAQSGKLTGVCPRPARAYNHSTRCNDNQRGLIFIHPV